MKRLFILTTLICFCMTGWGQHLTEQQVRENTKTALAKRPIKGMRAQQQGERLTLAYTGKDAAYYVFNHADEGYVVASAYENTPIILGYVDEGQFDVNHAPDGCQRLHATPPPTWTSQPPWHLCWAIATGDRTSHTTVRPL